METVLSVVALVIGFAFVYAAFRILWNGERPNWIG